MTAPCLRRPCRPPVLHRLLPLLLALLALCCAGAVRADPPARVARISYLDGAVSLSPAPDGQWQAAPLNRPMGVGDRLWSDQNASAELEFGAATARVGPRSDLTMLDFDDRIAQLRLTQGTLRLRVARLDPGQSYEIATPNLAFTVATPGEYRVDVDPADDSTVVMVRRGQARVDGQDNAYTIHEGRAYRFWGTRLLDQEELAMPPLDGLEQWARERDQRAEQAAAAAWVSPEVIGYQDLDAWGSWRTDAEYGAVWTPTSVVSGWAPYVYGHWSWIAPWGWTWIDDAPWGFAVTHYGRWAHLGGRWCWVPGPARARAVYAPALVAFVGGSGMRLSASFRGAPGVAWFPLGPREVYRPPYRASRNYFTTINVTNTIVDARVVHEVYDGRTQAPHPHLNRNVPGAVVAMPERGFARGESVRQTGIRVRREDLGRSQPIDGPAITPLRPESRVDGASGRTPPVRERPVIMRNTPQTPSGRSERGPDTLQPGRDAPTRQQQMERPGRVDRTDRMERSERIDRTDRPGAVERGAPLSVPATREYRTQPRTEPGTGVGGGTPLQPRPAPDGMRTPAVPAQPMAPTTPTAPARPVAPATPARPAMTSPADSREPSVPRRALPGAQRVTPQEQTVAPQRAVPQSAPQPAPRSVPQSVPRSVPQSAPRSAPQFAPQSAPQSVPQPTRQPLIRSAPESAPRFAPQSTPRSAPQLAPQAAPRRFEAPQAPRQGAERRDRGTQQR